MVLRKRQESQAYGFYSGYAFRLGVPHYWVLPPSPPPGVTHVRQRFAIHSFYGHYTAALTPRDDTSGGRNWLGKPSPLFKIWSDDLFHTDNLGRSIISVLHKKQKFSGQTSEVT